MYPWKRFWCPRTGVINLTDGGYLVDPEAEWARFVDSDVVPFEHVAPNRCLILLGEPGMGKSSALRDEYEAVTRTTTATSDRTFWLDLHEVGSDIQLNRELVDAPEIAAWRDGDYNLHLFLDSFDECRMQIKSLVPRFLKELGLWPVERLYLRIASRTAEWPPTLEEGLHRFWSDDEIYAFELAPLRRRDVNTVAQQHGWDAEMFHAAISRADAIPLAIKPLTLDFLTRTYSESRTLPNVPLELYRKGMRLLGEETERRRELDLEQQLDGQRRVFVAEILAAVTVLANRAAFWNDVDRGDVPTDDVMICQVADSDDQPGDAPFVIDEAAVEEVLSTSLFSSRGPRRLGWAHQSYAEFLAASYMARTGLQISQIRQLLLDPEDSRLVPQLRGTAAWLAAMRDDVLQELIVRDPEAMLCNAASSLNATAREELVDALIKRFDQGTLIDWNKGHRSHYYRLEHPNLARQLRPYVTDKQHSSVARRVAIDIAEACVVSEVVNDLIEIALDNDEDIEARVNAAYAVTKIGSVEDRGRLRPLVGVKPDEDPNDELKGCGLRAAWPEHLSSDELFSVLTPFRGDLLGAYRLFVYGELAQKLPPTGLPRALQWVAEETEKDHLPFEFQQLTDGLLCRAWEHLDQPEVLNALAPAVLARIRHHDDVLGRRGDPGAMGILDGSDEKRRRLLAKVVSLASDDDRRWLPWSSLARNSDVVWILEQLPSLPVDERRSWAALLPLVLDYDDFDQMNAVLEARHLDEVVREALAPCFDPIPLDSPRAQRNREHNELTRRWQAEEIERAASTERLQVMVSARIITCLDQLDAGDLDAWWRLNFELAVDPAHQTRESEYETDITSLPGWNDLIPSDRIRTIDAADRYIREQVPSGNDWIGTDTIHRPDWGAYRALRLLWQEAPERLTKLPAAVWETWAEVIIGVRTLNSDESALAQRPLVHLAYQHSPERVLAALHVLIERTDETNGPDIESILGRVADCWDDQLVEAMLDRAKDQRLTPRIRGWILQALISQGAVSARAIAEEQLRLPLSADAGNRDLAVQAAVTLIRETEDAGWPVVWPAIMSDSEFGEQVIGRLIWDDRLSDSTVQRLPVPALSNLYLWLARRFPYEEDVRPSGFHEVNFREQVGFWRDKLLRVLVDRGSRESVEAVQYLAAELPHVEWLKWRVLDAQEVTRYRAWTPPSIEKLRLLLTSPAKRIVQSPQQLLDVILESFGRLEERLQQAEPPAAIDLWNEIRPKVYSPKSENQFSDYVARHLEQDLADRGVVVNREVVVRRGQRTDIRVSVSRIEDTEMTPYPITVVIEAKGCWNRADLDTAMEEQLCGRYMDEARTRHGIYLVGWFKCDLWTDEDYRKANCPTYGVEEAKRRFDLQVERQTADGKYVRAFVMNASLR